MSIFCLIPTKPYRESKSRLAPVLAPEQRLALSRWLMRRTLRLARAVVGQVVVVSRDHDLLAEAEAQGAWGLVETAPGLNPALSQGAHFARARGATGLLVLPTDLPRLTAADLKRMLVLGGACGAGCQPALLTCAAGRQPALLTCGAGRQPALLACGAGCQPALLSSSQEEPAFRDTQHPGPTLVIAPCRHATGTNALLVRPPHLIPFAFGPDSFAAHSAAARAAGVEPIVYHAETIAFDLDTPQDWEFGTGKWGLRDREFETRD